MIDLEELRARAEASKLRTVDEYGMVQLTGRELLELLDECERWKRGHWEVLTNLRDRSFKVRELESKLQSLEKT